jgi:two-component system sensor histidine kinase CpxA
LHSAIENVVRNAIRYSREGTTVEIELQRTERTEGPNAEALVSVTDCGPGVPPDSLEKLFQPFYRLDDARGRLTGGVGLGLAITERAVRFHGGSVVAHNRSEGGLLVEIRLPLTSGSPGTAKAAEPVAVAHS